MKLITRSIAALLFSLLLAGGLFAQPNSPTNLTAVQGNWGNFIYVRLAWQSTTPTPVMMSGPRFNIYRKDGPISDTASFHKLYSHVSMDFWIDRFVTRGATYSYYVTEVNRSGESKPSDTVETSLDTNVVKAWAYGSLKSSSSGNAVVNGRISFIPVFGWGLTNVRTDSNGNYKAHLFPGTYIILVNADGFVPEFYNNVFRIFNATKVTFKSSDSLNFNFTLVPRTPPQKFALTGNVKDSLGNPVKAWIEVYNVSDNSFHRRTYHAVTDSSGNYSVNVLKGDTVVVYAHSLNHDFLPQFYNDKSSFLTADRIGISSDTSNINFLLEHKPVYNNGLSGVVMNSDSAGVESLILAINMSAAGKMHKRYSTFSDSLGAYQFSNLNPGEYILLAIPEGDYMPTYYRTDGTQTLRWKDADSIGIMSSSLISGVDFTVTDEPDSGLATVSGHVSDNSNNPIAGAIVFATDANYQVYSFGITDQNGNYTITGLVPGSYSVTSSSYGYSDGTTSTSSLDYNTNYSSTSSFTMTPEAVTAVSSTPSVISSYQLYQNYPNPFNPSTVIKFNVPNESRVTLKVYNILGSEVATLVNGMKPAGTYNITFNASNLASGVYFYQLKAGNFVATKKLLLLK